MATTSQKPVLYYITNPMCAWCYGFTPTIRRLWGLWQGHLEVKVLFGNLQAFATEPLRQEEKERLALSWHRVQERTSLPFDYRFFTQKEYIYDTEPACRALLAIKLLRPTLTLEVLRAFHSAFYADGRDLTNLQVLINLVKLFGISENLFLTLFESDEIMAQMEEEFLQVEQMGATSYPSVYIQSTQGAELLMEGLGEFRELEERLLQRLRQT